MQPVYVSEKFKEALGNLNTNLEKQSKVQSARSPHSKEYQESLRAEIELLEQKKVLLRQESVQL